MRALFIGFYFVLVAGNSFAQNCLSPALGPANNKFGFDIYNYLLQQKGVVFFSPYSIYSALQMTAEGAKGTTASEMSQTLYSKNNLDCIRNDISKSQQRYNSLMATGDSIHVANSLWVQNSFPLNNSFTDLVKSNYKASVREMDFLKNAEGSRKTINDWVEQQTNKRIKDLLAQGTVSPDTKLVLVNTIWLKAKWLMPFDPANTRDEVFHATDKEIKTPFMHKMMPVNYVEDETMQMIELPYKDKKISMMVLLPVKGEEKAFENKVSSEQVDKWIAAMKTEKTNISLPKLKLNSSFNLNDVLTKLGMRTAFSDNADFSGISRSGLKISDVIHKAFIEVDEDGTEAAAATAVTMVTTSMRPPDPQPIKVFKADRPFVFFLYDKEAKTILFMGKMERP